LIQINLAAIFRLPAVYGTFETFDFERF